MSLNLYWMPEKDRKGISISPCAELKDIIRNNGKEVFGQEDYDYLRGLQDAGVGGADELIDALLRHGEIRVWIA